MSAWARADYENQRRRWLGALRDIADKHGKGSRVYRLLGTLAWGRFEGESKPNEHKDDVASGYGYLKGYRDACLHAAELMKDKSEEDFRLIHRSPRGPLL